MPTLYRFITAMFLSPLLAASEPVSTDYWGDTAIGGHDTVSYHQQSHTEHSLPQLGKATFLVRWNNANWKFASQASADRFTADPEKYRPQYNGHCSNALSLGEGLIATEGTVWEFFDGKLHLFYAERGRQRWLNGDWKMFRQQADKAWQRILKNQ